MDKLSDTLIPNAVHALFKYESKRMNESSKNDLLGSYSKPLLVQVIYSFNTLFLCHNLFEGTTKKNNC